MTDPKDRWNPTLDLDNYIKRLVEEVYSTGAADARKHHMRVQPMLNATAEIKQLVIDYANSKQEKGFEGYD
jgi:hypothetical protein